MPGVSAAALLANLGDDSALARHERGGGWPLGVAIAVRTLEEVNHLGRLMMALKGIKKSKLPPPLIIPRPDEPKAPPQERSWIGDLIAANGVEVRGG
jgi:hypothetical protein